MAKPTLLIVAALGLSLLNAASACASPRPSPSASPLQTAEEFAGCKWERVSGTKFSISSFNCDNDRGEQHLVADDLLPGFWLTGRDGVRSLAVRIFSKARKASITSILPAVRAGSKGPQTRTCQLVYSAAESQDHPALKRYVLQPGGAAMEAWVTAQDKGEADEQPCGPLGVAVVGDRYFEVMPGHPELVMFVDMGSEIQIFDPATLRRVAKP